MADPLPFSPDEISKVETATYRALQPIQAYIRKLRDIAVDPAAFLQLPMKQEQLQNLIDAYTSIFDLLPERFFCNHMDEMLLCWDQLADLESSRTAQGNLPSLFSLEIELSEQGFPRLAIPQDFVETLINDAGLINPEIASLLGIFPLILITRLLKGRLVCRMLPKHCRTPPTQMGHVEEAEDPFG